MHCGTIRPPPGSSRGSPRWFSRRVRSIRSRPRLAFIPRYYGLAACELLLLVGLAWAQRRGILRSSRLASIVFCLTLAEVGGFGIGLNPAIEPGIQQFEPPVIAMLRAGLGPGQRALGIGQELPPNVLMRFGLDDPRNYDSVELATSLKWLEPLFEPGPEALSSRREITWEGVHRAGSGSKQSCVAAVVGATPPPAAWFPRVDRAGDVWIAWLAPARLGEHRADNRGHREKRAAGRGRSLVRGTRCRPTGAPRIVGSGMEGMDRRNARADWIVSWGISADQHYHQESILL